MDQFTKEGRKLRPRKTAATSGASFEKVEYSNHDPRPFDGEKRTFNNERRGYGERRQFDGEHRSYGERKSYGERRSYDQGGERRSFGGERRSFGEHKSFGSDRRNYGDRKPFDGERRQFDGEQRSYGERKSYGERRSYDQGGERRSFSGERRSYSAGRNFNDARPFDGERRQHNDERRQFDGERRSFNTERKARPAGAPGNGPRGRKPAQKPLTNPFGTRTLQGITRMIDRRPVVNDRECDERFEAPIKNEIRLNKFIANSGVCSRREADTLIMAGVVTVNGEIVTELGTKVNVVNDDIRFNGERLHGEEKVYIIMNKPKGFVTTASDPHADKTVLDLVKNCPTRVYPVGRLDKNTTGVLMLTNDGEIAERLTHPSYDKKKIYQVAIDKEITEEDFQKVLEGVSLTDGVVKADELEYIDAKDQRKLGIEIHSGKNRVVRRIFESLGYNVKALDRVYFAGVTKKGLKRGEWRYLTEGEVNILKMGAYI